MIINTKQESKVCFVDLVNSFNFLGTAQPLKEQIIMCPSIEQSCCQKGDQEQMYLNWIQQNEQLKVQEYYDKNNHVYLELIKLLQKVQLMARNIRRNSPKKLTNCNQIAKRILTYSIKNIKKQIRRNLTKMKLFFQKTYAGFYCSICNFDNQEFFDRKKMEITFSTKFCRDIVENSLPSLLLFHVDIVKLLNLTTRMLEFCDYRGLYDSEKKFPEQFIFAQQEDIVDTLNSCRDNVNKPSWFGYCKDLCTNFNMVEFPKYFEPNLSKIFDYNKYLQKKIEEKKIQALHRLIQKKVDDSKTKKRMAKKRQLEETDHLELNEIDTRDTNVFTKGLTAKVDLSKWSVDFMPDGIDMYDEGAHQLITKTTYDSIKALLQLERRDSNIQKAAILDSKDQQILKVMNNEA